jgi:hypothetical protein
VTSQPDKALRCLDSIKVGVWFTRSRRVYSCPNLCHNAGNTQAVAQALSQAASQSGSNASAIAQAAANATAAGTQQGQASVARLPPFLLVHLAWLRAAAMPGR